MFKESGITDDLKHIAIEYHFMRDMIDNHVIDVQYAPTENNTADVLSKRLPGYSIRDTLLEWGCISMEFKMRTTVEK